MTMGQAAIVQSKSRTTTMKMTTTPRVTVISERAPCYAAPALPPRAVRQATPGAYAGAVLSLLSATVALAMYDLYVLVTLTIA
jgi:hypothetical protein